ncbi:conjugal transfer protein MobC [Chitinophaga pollutisoli]|uniref:Conjugal transfer protein MobC n=1 Tax=Chitinophaga pollutisoli TaxID=3133966 RepID=A0ABZ2YPA2_9BACT|nr:conjugal transfer protein MobC [Chitinophaga rhizosphaerae]
MQNGENTQALRSILDFLRLGSVVVMLIHFYASCFPLFAGSGLSVDILDRFVYDLCHRLPFLSTPMASKSSALLLLAVSMLGSKGRKDEKMRIPPVVIALSVGLLLLYSSTAMLHLQNGHNWVLRAYIFVSSVAFLTVLYSGSRLSRYLRLRFQDDIFNEKSESFPQCEELHENEFSVNLPARYQFRGKMRSSFINLLCVFRGTLILGSPGSGKTYFFFSEIIRQHLMKGFCMFVFDFKFPTLSQMAYNYLREYAGNFSVNPQFVVINFDDLNRTHRVNALPPDLMPDITDATESSRTFMLALNKEWAKKSDFFVESAITFCTALFWFLKKYEGGRYCTLPHAIELSQIEYTKLFPVLAIEPEISVLINPFISALKRGANEQLEGQIASAKIAIARLASPSLYYVLSGNDFDLDLNNPKAPKVICAGSNPAKRQIYGAVLSLYVERMLKLVNQEGKAKSSLIFDEFPTIYVPNIDALIATARSNKVATTLGVQDMSQLVQNYGKENADVIMNIAGNIVSGQVMGDSARQLSDRIGKIMQERESISINSSETSLSRSTQLETAVPPSKIAMLSSGQFVGLIADEPSHPIKLKAFHAEVAKDHNAARAREKTQVPIPAIRDVSKADVDANFRRIKQDVHNLIEREMEKIKSSPEYQAMQAAVADSGKKSSVSM